MTAGGSDTPRKDPVRIDRYEVVDMLGKGSMGVLYRARDPDSGNEVAIKILASELLSNGRAVERFKREIRSSIQLEHANLVAALAAGQHEGKYYYVMEFVDGATVKRLLRSRGPFDVRTAVSIVTQVARAIQYAGQFGIVHRDIKPDNILVGADGVTKLADMGLAKSMDSQNKLTLTGSVLGTPHYMSPEQARGEEDIDVRSDVYSLGATFYHMLAGRPPFDGDDPVGVLTRLLASDPPGLREIDPRIPGEVCHVVAKMMARDRDKRYPTAEALLTDLELLDRNETTTAESDGAAGPSLPGKDHAYRYRYVPPRLDLLFGLILVNSHAITRDQMSRALDRQEQLALGGIEVPLANVVVEMNLLTRDQRGVVEETLTRHLIQVGQDAYVRAVAKSEFLSARKMADYRSLQQETGLPLGQILLDADEFGEEESRVIRALQQCMLWADEDRAFLKAAVDHGFLSAALAERSLVIQNNKAVQGHASEIGQILVQKELLHEDQRRAILRAVRRHQLTGVAVDRLLADGRTPRAAAGEAPPEA